MSSTKFEKMEDDMPFKPRSLPDRDQLLADNPGLEERFRTKVTQGSSPYSGCWEWTGATNRGYGYFHVCINGESQSVLAHRVVYILHYGSIDDDLYACHHCGNKACVRPDHLILGSHSLNMQDMAASRRVRGSVEGRGGTINEVIAGRVSRSDLDDDDD